jgi:hypothetical protein
MPENIFVLPFLVGIVASLFALVGLFVGFEVYRMPFILRTLQNVGNGIYRSVIPTSNVYSVL